MKKGDLIAVLYVIAYAATVFFFPYAMKLELEGLTPHKAIVWDGIRFGACFTDFVGLKNFGEVVAAFPYLSGFLKVGLLATFGEMLKTRGRTGSWTTPALFPKFIVWGLFGMLFTYVFALFAKGAGSMMGSVLWPLGGSGAACKNFWFALTTSFWLNMIFCYPMMLSHEWFNTVITKRRFIGGEEFLNALDKHIWGSFMLKTIVVFWIPAHTVTFCLPENYRVLMSAFLSLALGFILTVKPHKK